MKSLVAFLITGCLIQGVLCGLTTSMSQNVKALQGSCVFINCRFEIFQHSNNDLTDSAKRLWLREPDGVVVFNSSSPDTGLFKGEMFGTPTQKNCNTRFDNVSQAHNGKYYFRLEANGDLQHTYKDRVEIAVTASPPKPKLLVFEDEQELTEVMELTEGRSANLRCFMILCPSHPTFLTWSSTPAHPVNQSIPQLQHDASYLISELNFIVTQRHHRATVTCTVTHQLQQNVSTHSSRQLSVQYAPKNTSVHVIGSVVEGGSVTLSCSSESNPVVNYTWIREGDLNILETGPDLTINNINPTHRGQYYCRAKNQHGTQNTSVLLDVQYAPKNTSAHVAGSVVEGGSVTLSCSSESNPVVNYTWIREGDLKTLQTGPNLTINNINLTHSGRYYCKAENQHGTQNTSVLLDVQSSISQQTNFCLRSAHD